MQHSLADLPTSIALSDLTRSPFAMVLTNPRLDDNPIVYANRAFEEVTGYSMASVVGRNCRFLQGVDTSPEAVKRLRDGIEAGESVTVDLRNYTADGTNFFNRLMIAPLHDETEELVFFLGVQMRMDREDLTSVPTKERERIETALDEIQHRVKNHLAMIVSMIRLQSNEPETDQAKGNFDTLARRVETLQLLYEELSGRAMERNNEELIQLGAYLSRVANAIAHMNGRRGVRVNIDADAIEVPFEIATRMGLIVSELMTNALQHAFGEREAGIVEVRIKELSNGTIRLQVSDDGTGLPDDVDWPNQGGLGSRIVRQLVTGLEGSLSVDRAIVGTIITVDTPRGHNSEHVKTPEMAEA